MSRFEQQQATKGSQKWLQILVNDRPDLLAAHFRAAAKLPPPLNIEWLSPLASDGYAEYQDSDFLNRLGVTLPANFLPTGRALQDFWPERGPVWDGLGKSGEGHLILIEAKAHISEIASPSSAASSGGFHYAYSGEFERSENVSRFSFGGRLVKNLLPVHEPFGPFVFAAPTEWTVRVYDERLLRQR